ncbi:RCC1 domain-containing protein [Coraliomargarita akajimensis]|uniref:Uncharacterized protein n=1 Tax=Coraliomargarita akajimensis (strain DSM 45221 / IAM 15411 / JCM 23193 / KCTC 12865 / 04OKA010-24) TaxID=583355 RepID=D5ER23_CORAD|nr:hypothetical protein Caka_0994 [Coraliomargarita akajimensis DSM 45221]
MNAFDGQLTCHEYPWCVSFHLSLLVNGLWTGHVLNAENVICTLSLPLDMPDQSPFWSSENHSFSLKSDGTLFEMGQNSNGQLGDGSTIERHHPVQITNRVVAQSSGTYHSLFWKIDDSLCTIARQSPVLILCR